MKCVVKVAGRPTQLETCTYVRPFVISPTCMATRAETAFRRIVSEGLDALPTHTHKAHSSSENLTVRWRFTFW